LGRALVGVLRFLILSQRDLIASGITRHRITTGNSSAPPIPAIHPAVSPRFHPTSRPDHQAGAQGQGEDKPAPVRERHPKGQSAVKEQEKDEVPNGQDDDRQYDGERLRSPGELSLRSLSDLDRPLLCFFVLCLCRSFRHEASIGQRAATHDAA
jgi:hypothetical protein